MGPTNYEYIVLNSNNSIVCAVVVTKTNIITEDKVRDKIFEYLNIDPKINYKFVTRTDYFIGSEPNLMWLILWNMAVDREIHRIKIS